MITEIPLRFLPTQLEISQFVGMKNTSDLVHMYMNLPSCQLHTYLDLNFFFRYFGYRDDNSYKHTKVHFKILAMRLLFIFLFQVISAYSILGYEHII